MPGRNRPPVGVTGRPRAPGVVAAFGLFSVIPMPALPNVDRQVTARAIRAFGWMGLLLGMVAGLIVAGVLAAGAGPWLAAILALAWLTAATGGFHLDGVADTADGLASRKPTDEALAIMKRSDIGPMGVISLVLVLLVDLGSLSSLATTLAGQPGAWWRLGLVMLLGPSSGRAAILLATHPSLPCARPGGFGSLVAGVTPTRTAVVQLAGLGLVWATVGWAVAGPVGTATTVGAGAVALGWSAAWARHLVRRLGGLTGDCFGSLIETTQVVAWLLLALAVPRLW